MLKKSTGSGEGITRRRLLAGLFVAALGPATGSFAQERRRLPTVGIIRGSGYDPDDPSIPLNLQSYRERGYEDGHNIRIDQRYAAGDLQRLSQIAQEFVQERVDVIVTANEPALRAAKQATSTIPIVFTAWDYDPLASGLIHSLNRAGGNVTGVSLLQTELLEKRLELLKEALPSAHRILVFWDSFSRKQLDKLRPAARALDLELRAVEITDISEVGSLLRAARRRGDAAMFLYSPAVYTHRNQVAAEAIKAALPTMFQDTWFTTAGGLLSYGPDIKEVLNRVAYLVDRILKGTNPSALPVEQVSRFHLAVNLKTAKALGITIPASVLIRADEVIQ